MFQKILFGTLVGVLCAVLPVSGDDNFDLRLNGDFRGGVANAATAPGWTVVSGGGATRIVPSDDFDDFAVEISATAQKRECVYSEFFPVMGNLLEVEAEIRGNGSAVIGFAAYDASRKELNGGERVYNTSAGWVKTRSYFPVTDPAVKFVRIILAAAPGSTVTFGDIEGEFKRNVTLPRDVSALSGTLPVVTTATEVVPVASVAGSGNMPVQGGAVAGGVPLIHRKYYSLSAIADNSVYQATVPLNGEIDFELAEDTDNGYYWTISSYDSRICRVEMEHDRDGFWPFRYDKAEIELKGLMPGSTMVVFTHPTGKVFRVLFTVR